MRHALVISLLSLAACGAPSAPELSESPQAIENVEIVLRLMAANRLGGSPALPSDLTLHFVQDVSELPPECNCVGYTQGHDVWVAMVDDMDSKRATTEVSRTPLIHELIHVLYGDANHTKPELWQDLLPATYNALNCTDYKVGAAKE